MNGANELHAMVCETVNHYDHMWDVLNAIPDNWAKINGEWIEIALDDRLSDLWYLNTEYDYARCFQEVKR